MNYLFLILLGLAIPIGWTAAFFMALGARARLALLETRFVSLERRLIAAAAGAGTVAPATPSADRAPDPGPHAGRVEAASGPPAPPEPPLPLPAAAPAVAPPETRTEDAVPDVARPAQSAARTDARAEPPAFAPSSEPPLEAPVVDVERAAGTEPSPDPPSAAESPAGALPGDPPAGVDAPVPPSPEAPSREVGFEEMLGTRWVVWVGGVALALGAIFLVRYTIEQGLIGPGARIVLGALFAAALIAAGEWTRRQEDLSGIRGLPQASIPAILTAAGTTAAYATIWAAYGLYAFIGAGAAFVLLGLVAVATLAAALLHGPALAGVGLIGAYVTPLLVRSPEPNFWALYVYLAVVTAAAFLLARIRLWRWLALAAVGLSLVWLLPGLHPALLFPTAPHVFHVVVGFALAATLIVAGLLHGPALDGEDLDNVSCVAVGGYLLAAASLAIVTHHDATALFGFILLTVATVGIAWRTTATAWTLPLAALASAYVIGQWSLLARGNLPLGPLGGFASGAPVVMGADIDLQVGLGAAFAALFGVTGFLAQGRYGRALVAQLWAGSAVLAPLAILVALYYRIAGFERSIPLAFAALVLAALFAGATETLSRRPPRPGSAAAQALFAVGAVAALALSLTFALEQGWLTVAFALMAPGIAMVADRRPLPFLRVLAASIATLVCARVLWQPQIARDLGTTPIFNWLLWGYGVPAAAFWSAGHILRRRGDDAPARTLDAAAILFTVLTVTLEIRHYVTGGFIYARSPSPLVEFGLDVSALAAISIGLERLRQRSHSIVHTIGATAAAGLAIVLGCGGLLLLANPLFRHQEIGGLYINEILLAYGVPALLFGIAGHLRRQIVDDAVAWALEVCSIVFALAFAVLEVRHAVHGDAMQVWRGAGLGELGVDVSILIAVAIGLDRLRRYTLSGVHERATSFVALLAVIAAVLGPLLFANPLFAFEIVVGRFVNLILLAYGLPALLFAVAGHLRGRNLRDNTTRMLDAAAIVFAVAFALLELRRLVHGEFIGHWIGTSLTEIGIDVSILLAIAIGLEWLRRRTLNPVHDRGAEAVAALALGFIVFGLMIGNNPALLRQDVGGLFFNLLMLCYGLPAVMAIALALVARGARPMSYRAVAAGTAVVLTLAYLTLEVRRLYQGPFIDAYGGGHGTSDAELWTYSAVWLAYGVVLLVAGIMLRSPPARLASALVILITVLKVFLYDLAGIGGVWRAFSFIGLGLVLVGIGWIYQKLLFPPKPPQVVVAAPAE